MGVATPHVPMARWMEMIRPWSVVAITLVLVPPIAAAIHAAGDTTSWVSFLARVFWWPWGYFGF